MILKQIIMRTVFCSQMLLFSGIITAQRIKEFSYSDVDCSYNCSKSSSSSFYKCVVNYLIYMEPSVFKKPLITFEISEIKSLIWETLFTMDLESHCNGYKDAVDFYCTQKELDVYILSIYVNNLKINKEAEIRLYITTSDGNKVYSGFQRLPKVYGINNATGQLTINGRKIISKENCNVTVKDKQIFFQFNCVNFASPCITEIEVNDVIVSKTKGEYASYKENYETGLTLNVTIRIASCIYMSCTVITDSDETSDIKSNQSSKTTLHFLLFIGVPLIGGIFLVVALSLCWLQSFRIWRKRKRSKGSRIQQEEETSMTEDKDIKDYFDAARNKNFHKLKFLYGANTHFKNIKDTDSNTTLMIAAEKGYEEIAHYLIENGEDIELENKKGMTALKLAQANNHVKIVTHLKRAPKKL